MTLREHLEAAWQATGVIPAQLANAPALPLECADLWRAFINLRSACQSSGHGPGCLSYSEIDAYQRTTGECLLPWEVQAIRAADNAYLAAWAEARD